jgi:hypothetical protein
MDANWDSSCIAFIRFDLGFQTEAHRTEAEVQFHRADAEDAAWFVTPPREQLALIAVDRPHRFPFVEGFRVAEGVGNAPTSAMPILFSRQV